MFATAISKPARWIGKGLRELILILGVGVLGSQLLIALNGGAPIGTRAEAASSTAGLTQAVISSIHYEINPVNPAEFKSVQLSATLPDGSSPQALRITLSPSRSSTHNCQHDDHGLWTCPTPGISIIELESVVAMGY
jgi:hypothetical protein